MGSDFFNTFGLMFFENAPESGRADRFSCVEIGAGRRGPGFGVSPQQTATAASPRTTPSLLSANAGLTVKPCSDLPRSDLPRSDSLRSELLRSGALLLPLLPLILLPLNKAPL